MIKARRVDAHRVCMLAAVASSTVFLTSYLYYHARVGHVVYHGPARPAYLLLLLTHTVLAAAVVPLLIPVLRHAVGGRFEDHKRWAKRLLPIWLYVSVTGVVVYAMLYHL
jgi:uncharacterized membrane protein YozB (DUF420 family)